MGKKVFASFILFLVGVLLVGCGSGNSSKNVNVNNGDETIELNVNNWAPSTHHIAINVLEPWKEYVEEKTDGRVQVNLYHGGSLGKTTSVYQDVKGGLYEVSLLPAAYFHDTKFFPYSIANLPFAFEGSEQGSKIMKKFGKKYANKDLTDIVVMAPVASDPYNLFSSKPIKSMDDLKKLKMRVGDKNDSELVKALGGIPVSLSVEETYEGLQKNTIETTFYSPIGANGYKFFEPAPYITKINVATTLLIPVMNKDFYDKLPDDLKTMFDDDLNPKLTELYQGTYTKELKAAFDKLEQAVSKRGEMIVISDEEVQRFKTAGKSAWDAWIKDANDRGYPGQEMVDDLLKMLEEEGYPAPY